MRRDDWLGSANQRQGRVDSSCLRHSKDCKFASKVGFCTGYKNTISAAASCLTHRYESGIDLLIKLSETNQIPQNFKLFRSGFFEKTFINV